MPNPFPGMDPYLEGPLWSSLHGSLVEEIARQLNPMLQPTYLALPNSRVVLTRPDPIELLPVQDRFPDVGVYGTEAGKPSEESETLTAPLTLTALMPEAITQSFIEIVTIGSRTLVTAIEILSPTNKRGAGLRKFRKKRQELLGGPAHYLEIDLLRIGKRFPVMSTLPSVPYFVFLSRANRRPRTETWPIVLNQPLPKVPVPLLPVDVDVTLDLQLAWNTIYNLYAYDRVVSHEGKPRVKLSVEQQSWADECLRKAGMKS